MATSTPSGKPIQHYDQYFASFLRLRGVSLAEVRTEEGLRLPEPSDPFEAYYPARCDPWLAYTQLRKYALWPKEPDWDLFWMINDHMIEYYKLYVPSTRPVTLTSVLKWLDMRKSPGRFWKLFGKDKLELLETEEGLRLFLTDYLRLIMGENVESYQSACLKSELRAKQKVFADPPSTRLFLGADIVSLAASHTYCLDFNDKFCKQAFVMDHAVGPGKYYGNTDTIYRALSKFAAVMSYDNIEWDGHVYAFEMQGNYIIRYQCMDRKFHSQRTRDCLANICYANTHGFMIMPDGVVVRNYIPIKNPSGQGNTSQDNTMVHQRRFYMFWFAKAPPDMRNFAALLWHTIRMFYSDDGAVSVSSDVLLWCNIQTYAEWSAEHGWRLEHGPMRTAMESEFLGTVPAFFANSIVPRLPFSRCFCGMLKGAPSPVATPVYSFERACAYRIENFFHPEWRSLITEYINYLVSHYRIPMSQTSMFLSSLSICRLYGVPDSDWTPSDLKFLDWVQLVKLKPDKNESLRMPKAKPIRNGKQRKSLIQQGVNIPAGTSVSTAISEVAAAASVRPSGRLRGGRSGGGGGAPSQSAQDRVNQQMRDIVKIPNQYLKSLCLPETYGPIAYPDQFLDKSTTFGGIINTPMPYLAATVGNTPAGTFLAVCRPLLVDPVQALVVAGANTVLRLVSNTQNENYGLFSISDGDHTVARDSTSMELITTYQNLVTVVDYNSGDDVGAMFHGQGGGTDFFGTPADGAGSTVTAFVNCQVPLPSGQTILVRAITTAGPQAPQTLAQVGASQTYTVAWTPSAWDAGLPGMGFQFALGGTATAQSQLPLVSVQVTFNGTASSFLQWQSYQIPDLDMALGLYDSYRVVSMSQFVTYRGSMLDNGGQIAATLFRGGEPPSINDLYTYDQVSQCRPSAYDGPLIDGSYTYWEPADTHDMDFREPKASNPWLHPYTVCAGVVSEPSQVNSLRLRVVLNFEAISRSQLLHYSDSRVNPQEIAHAAMVLRNRPTSMSNKSHLKTLEDFLKGAMMEIPRVLNWVAENKSWLIPAGAAVGSILL